MSIPILWKMESIILLVDMDGCYPGMRCSVYWREIMPIRLGPVTLPWRSYLFNGNFPVAGRGGWLVRPNSLVTSGAARPCRSTPPAPLT